MTDGKCVNYHCNLYDDDIAVCSYADYCFPDTAIEEEEDSD